MNSILTHYEYIGVIVWFQKSSILNFLALEAHGTINSPKFPKSYDSTTAYRSGESIYTYEYSTRIIFVVNYVNLSPGDTLSLHIGNDLAYQSCSHSSSNFLRSYTGMHGQMKDVVYAGEDYSCVQFEVVGTNSRIDLSSLGYSIEVYGKS